MPGSDSSSQRPSSSRARSRPRNRNEAEGAYKGERCQVCECSTVSPSAGRHLSTIMLCPRFVDRRDMGTRVSCFCSFANASRTTAGSFSGRLARPNPAAGRPAPAPPMRLPIHTPARIWPETSSPVCVSPLDLSFLSVVRRRNQLPAHRWGHVSAPELAPTAP
jgi:hypothetical protein